MNDSESKLEEEKKLGDIDILKGGFFGLHKFPILLQNLFFFEVLLLNIVLKPMFVVLILVAPHLPSFHQHCTDRESFPFIAIVTRRLYKTLRFVAFDYILVLKFFWWGIRRQMEVIFGFPRGCLPHMNMNYKRMAMFFANRVNMLSLQ